MISIQANWKWITICFLQSLPAVGQTAYNGIFTWDLVGKFTEISEVTTNKQYTFDSRPIKGGLGKALKIKCDHGESFAYISLMLLRGFQY
jgi:hypothetical protein